MAMNLDLPPASNEKLPRESPASQQRQTSPSTGKTQSQPARSPVPDAMERLFQQTSTVTGKRKRKYDDNDTEEGDSFRTIDPWLSCKMIWPRMR